MKGYIEVYTRNYEVYFDKDRLIPGYQYDMHLARAICKSACMVILYWPSYLDSDYCQQEITTMLGIEKKRIQLLGNQLSGYRLFVPIVLRGDYNLLPEPVRSVVNI